MTVGIYKNTSHTIAPKGYARTYPMENVVNELDFSNCLLLVEANQIVNVTIQEILEEDLILAMVEKSDDRGKVLETFQAQFKRASFSRMIDPDYSNY